MASKNNFFNRRLRLLADYQFNNNLIDDAGGNNGTGTDITYDNGSAVFGGIPSKVLINNLGAFDFTDGVKDLPFKIETSIVLNSLPSGNANPSTFIIGRRDDLFNLQNYQFVVREKAFEFYLFSTNPTSYISVQFSFNENLLLNYIYEITITYDGNKTNQSLKMVVNGVEQIGGAISNTYTGQQLTNTNVYLGIAGFDVTTSRFYFDGKIDYLKIYK